MARYRPPSPSGDTTTATTRSAADAIGTMRSACRCVKGIVDMNCGRPFTSTAAETMPAADPAPPTTTIATSWSDSRSRKGSFALMDPAFEREETAGEPDDRPRQRVREQLARAGFDPERDGAILHVAHGEERSARLGDADPAANDEREREQGEREEIEPHVAAQERRPGPRSPGRGDVAAREQEHLGNFLERERRDRDLEPADAQRREAGNSGGRGRGAYRREQGDGPGCAPAAGVDRRERADAEERGVRQRQLARARDEHVETERGDRGHDDPDEDRQAHVAEEQRPAEHRDHDRGRRDPGSRHVRPRPRCRATRAGA